jgi:geranylgeranyl diphosphate synthase type II
MIKAEIYQELINKLIEEQNFKKQPAALYEPIHYVMSQGGKRLRPLLTLLSCDLFGGDLQKALYPAMAIEVFHNFTLVHDDIMDKAPLRRGKETVYKKWNSNIAILSGDTMFAMAYQFAIKTDHAVIPEILDVFSKTAIEVCEGQQLDMDFESTENVSIPEYIEMIRLKTAVLLAASLKIGAIAAGADENSIQKIYDFGIHLGIAFQLKDDLLDVYGDVEKFGKMSGGDIITGKKTYLILKALELATPEQYDRLRQLYSDSTLDATFKIDAVKEIFNALQIEKHVSQIMDEYFSKSLTYLANVSAPKASKLAVQEYALYLFNRNH